MKIGAQLRSVIDDFLAQTCIAVVGVSRSPNEAANVIYRKLRDGGYQVFAVNPNADAVEDVESHHSLAAVPGCVDSVVIATHPDVTAQVIRECVELGIHRVWIHRSFGQGSVSPEALELCERHGIRVIPGGCPMMFREPVDLGHRCMRFLLSLTGGLPKAA